MGISADIIIVKDKAENNKYIGEYSSIVNICGKEYIYYKEIIYIGSSKDFHNGILENYKDNEGILKLKDGWEYIKNKESIQKSLEEYFKYDLEYIFENNSLFINLNY